MCNEGRKVIEKQLYRNALLNVTVLEATTDGQENVLRGMMHSSMMLLDSHISKEISTQLFPSPNRHYGHDLTAIDIQRGRDHGVPGYNAYRKFCGLKQFESFEEIDCMDDDGVEILSRLYECVDDIDMLVGGLIEKPAHDSIFGPTITCILTEQFRRSVWGDRFFHTNKNQDYPFTSGG